MTPTIHCYTVWTAEQVANCIEGHDKKNELVKVEVTHGHTSIDGKSYQVIIWCLPIEHLVPHRHIRE